MNEDSDSKIRRSSRVNTRKRASKINYKEIEDGKDYMVDCDSSVNNDIHKDYEEEVLTKMKNKKGDIKLSHPKKSLTAYTLFVKLKRKELQEKWPNATTPELMKEIGRQWKSISEKDKAWYQNMAGKDKERYRREMEEMNKLKQAHQLDDTNLKRPKKCLSSYMIFVREVRAKVTQEFPDMNALDVMKEVGRRWQSITKEDKDYYQALADKDKERFKKENQKYMKELEQLDSKLKGTNKKKPIEIDLDQEYDDAAGSERKSQGNDSKFSVGANGKKMRRDPNMPKKPLSAYIYFSQETREQIKRENPKMPVSQIMKEVSNKWSEMSKEEREPYEKAAREDKERYKRDSETIKVNTKAMPDSSKDLDQDFEDLSEDKPAAKPKGRKRVHPSDDSFDDYTPNAKKPKRDNKVSINLASMSAKNPPAQKPLPAPPKKEVPLVDDSFKFNLPESRPMPSMNPTSPSPLMRKENKLEPPYVNRDRGQIGNSSYNQNDTVSGSTDNNQMGGFMYRPNMFSPSPSPFGQNRSPGVSPNMMPSYSPMMMRGNDSYRDYLSRNPSLMGQTPIQSVNRNETPRMDYNMMNMSPSGFTPMRTNFQKYNPMFSPAQNIEGHGLFAPSPNVNNMSYPSFGGPNRTPMGQMEGRGFTSFQTPRQNPPSSMPNNEQRKGQDGNGLFDLNPFGS